MQQINPGIQCLRLWKNFCNDQVSAIPAILTSTSGLALLLPETRLLSMAQSTATWSVPMEEQPACVGCRNPGRMAAARNDPENPERRNNLGSQTELHC